MGRVVFELVKFMIFKNGKGRFLKHLWRVETTRRDFGFDPQQSWLSWSFFKTSVEGRDHKERLWVRSPAELGRVGTTRRDSGFDPQQSWLSSRFSKMGRVGF